MIHLEARSISKAVHDRLSDAPYAGSILAVFSRACIFAAPGGLVVSLVHSDLGNGPLNIVLGTSSFSFQALHEGAPASLEDDHFCTAGLKVRVADAVIWEPRPDWSRLRSRRAIIIDQLPQLRQDALSCASQGSLLSLVAGQEPTSDKDSISRSVLPPAHRAARKLRRAWEGELAELGPAAAQLAGLGPGLTPAGDDFLAGVMLRTWLEDATPGTLCRLMLGAALPHTSVLSAAMLSAAARGECSEAWHQLFDALDRGSRTAIRRATRRVLSHGHTSGADALAGFLWLESTPA